MRVIVDLELSEEKLERLIELDEPEGTAVILWVRMSPKLFKEFKERL